jgi:hypothetical protein
VRQRQQWIIVGVVAAIVIAGITAIIVISANTPPVVDALASSPSSPDLTEEVYPEQGREHIQRGTPHEPYNSDPPTSGPHYADNMIPVPAGFYDETNAPLDEELIHAQEHGYVIIWYDCAKAPEGNCDGLKRGLRELRIDLGETKLIAVPRNGMPTMLALTSWTRLQRLDAFDTAKISSFYRSHIGQAPEPGGP